MSVRVQTDDFDVGVESRALQADTVGGIALFVGTVRGLSSDNGVTAMTLEHYPGMTEAELERIEAEAMGRWPLERVTIIHRVGRLLAGEQIVLVATASAHRQAAFDAAQFIMDFLKTPARHPATTRAATTPRSPRLRRSPTERSLTTSDCMW